MSGLPVIQKITMRDRLQRFVWALVRLTLYRPTPIMFHRWRRLVLTIFGARIDGRVYVYPDVAIWAPWNLHMADESTLGPGVICYNVAPIRIGRHVTVSQRSHLCTASHNFDAPDFLLTGAPIVLEDGAWIAAEAFVGPGVTVGRRAVVLARGVAVRDVPAGAVVGGNPARYLRDRAPMEGEASE